MEDGDELGLVSKKNKEKHSSQRKQSVIPEAAANGETIF